MRVLFLDIDGVAVKANIQGDVRQIELFGDEPIKDFEYIKNCIAFMLDKAKNEQSNALEIAFIEKVYKYISSNMFEMLKEYRDCFLEYDNLTSFEDKKKYIENYTKNPITSSNKEEIPSYMKYIISALKYAKALIESEYARVNCDGGKVILPFKTINEDNDIISYASGDDPLNRAKSALKRMEIYSINSENGRDDFLTACTMVGDNEIVNYNRIYTKENLMPGVVEGLKYLKESGKVDLIVACSHHTGPRESFCKMMLFNKELPFVIMIPESLLKFHTEPAQMGKRRDRSSKNLQIDKMVQILSQVFGCDVSEIKTMLVDDSAPNLEGLENKIPILFREVKENESPINQNFVRLENWSIESIDRAFEIIDKISSEDKTSGIENNTVGYQKVLI